MTTALAHRQSTAIARNDQLDTLTVARMLAESGFFGEVRDAGKALAKILAGQELGMGPIASLMGVYYQQGKVTYSANIMAAAVKKTGQYTYRVKKIGTAECSIEFFERRGSAWDSIGVSDFSIQDAQDAGLTTGANKHNWKNYPRNMLFARAMSNGVKWFTPDVFGGIPPYTPDELGSEVIVSDDGEMRPINGQIVDAPSPDRCDADHFNRLWHQTVKGTRFEDDDTRHKFIGYHTRGASESLTGFLQVATADDATHLIETIEKRIAAEAKKARQSLLDELDDVIKVANDVAGEEMYAVPDDIAQESEDDIRALIASTQQAISAAQAA